MKDFIFSIQRILFVAVGVIFCSTGHVYVMSPYGTTESKVSSASKSPYGEGLQRTNTYGAKSPGNPYVSATTTSSDLYSKKPQEAVSQSASAPSRASSSVPAQASGSYLKAVKKQQKTASGAYDSHVSAYQAPKSSDVKPVALHPSMVTSDSKGNSSRSLGFDGLSKDFSLSGSKVLAAEAVSPDISRLLQDSESAIRKLEDELTQKEQQLEDLAKKKLEHLQTKVEQEINTMRKKAEKMAVDMRSDIKEEALRLRHEAAHKTLGIISKTEEEALELKRKKRIDALNKRFGSKIMPSRRSRSRRARSVSRYQSVRPTKIHRFSFIPDESHQATTMNKQDMGSGERVSPEWKNDISRQFYNDMSYMKQIILQGESRHEIHDFNKRFTEQNRWFDKTLRSVRYVNDAHYVKIVKKQQRLHSVIAAQKQADAHLKKVVRGASLSLREKRKVRLMVLYDLNSLMQQREAQGGRRLLGALDIDEVTGIVKKTVEEFSVKFKERSGRFPDVRILDNKTTQVVPVMAQKLQEELEEVQVKLEEAEGKIQKERKKRKQLRVAARQKIQEKARERVDLELKLRKAKHDTSLANRGKEEAVKIAEINDDAKKELAKRLEQSEKEGMIFELEMKKAQEEVVLARDEAIKETQSELAEQLEEKEKKNLELTSLLQRVTDKAAFFKEKASELVGENRLAEEKASLAHKKAEEARLLAQKHAVMQKEAEAKATASKQLADKTVASINSYLKEQKKSLAKVKTDLTKAQQKLEHDKEIVSRERDELLAHKNLLSKEQGILEELKKETRSLVESSMRINDESLLDLLKLRQSTEYDLKKMQQEMNKELAFVRDEMKRIKGSG